jgi:hypothetical protein
MASIRFALNLVGIEPFLQQVFVGVVLIGAVYLDQVRLRQEEYWSKIRARPSLGKRAIFFLQAIHHRQVAWAPDRPRRFGLPKQFTPGLGAFAITVLWCHLWPPIKSSTVYDYYGLIFK